MKTKGKTGPVTGIIILAAILAAGLSGCDLNRTLSGNIPVEDFRSGNLVITNGSGEDLALFVDGLLLSGIPAGRFDFVADVPVTGAQQEKALRLYRAADVRNLKEPEPGLLFRSWNVVLEDSTSLADRRTWRVEPEAGAGSHEAGTVTFLYGSGSDFFVRVYVGGLTGACIATLSGQAGSLVAGLDYGLYDLTYEYVYDSGQGTAPVVAGVVDTEEILGETVPIYVVVNSGNRDSTVVIPHFEDTGDVPAEPSGIVRITNSNPVPVRVLADGLLIGDDASSIIGAGDTSEFRLSVGSHELEARSVAGAVLETGTCELSEDEVYLWTVGT